MKMLVDNDFFSGFLPSRALLCPFSLNTASSTSVVPQSLILGMGNGVQWPLGLFVQPAKFYF